MSLINNMLKELENRDKETRRIYPVPLLKLKRKRHFIFIQKKIILLFFFIVALFASFLSICLSNRDVVYLKPMLQKKELASLFNPESADINWLTKTLITGISFQVKDNVTEIIFSLNHATLYRIITDGFHNQVSLIVEASQLQSELPAINSLNTAIQHISVNRLHDDTQFLLTLYPGTEIKYVNLSDDKKNPELVIAIENQMLSQTQTKTISSTNLIKTPAMETLLNQQYQAGLEAAKKGQFHLAIQLLEAVLNRDSRFNEARVSLAALLLNQNQLSKAEKMIDEGLVEYPTYSPLVELKARVLTNLGFSQEALNLLQTALPPIEENPDYHAFMAALYERNNNDTVAIQIYKNLLAVNSHNGNWWFGLGVSLEKLGKSHEAQTAYTKALREGKLASASIAYLQKRLHAIEEEGNEKK